jgi:uncharacterized tellurite resistance protein B-like protein
MLASIKRFFDSHIKAAVDKVDGGDHGLRLATAALLIEVTRADHVVKGGEREAVMASLRQLYGLSAEELSTLFALAEQEVEQASSLYQFTSLVHNAFSLPQKIEIIELLWRVVYADGVMDKYEEATVRQVAELLYVPHNDFIAAKHRARGGR